MDETLKTVGLLLLKGAGPLIALKVLVVLQYKVSRVFDLGIKARLVFTVLMIVCICLLLVSIQDRMTFESSVLLK